jgi:hypothetical protein
MRADSNLWLVLCRANGHELYVVLEKTNETLLAASDMIHRFNANVLGGLFQED